MERRQINGRNLWNSLLTEFQETFFKPNKEQPQKSNPLASVSLRQLGFYKHDGTGKLIAPNVSRFSEDYYEDFQLKPIQHPTPFPFYITLTDDEVGRFSPSNSGFTQRKPRKNGPRQPKKHQILIEYLYSETDSLMIYERLTDLDKQILLFIALFKNVQFQQILRETGVNARKVEKSLKRLLGYYLIRQYQFQRDPAIVGEEAATTSGDCYAIYSYGTTVLLINQVISTEMAYKWQMAMKEDAYSPIRYWKIADAYLNMRVKDDFVGFLPYSSMESFVYTEETSSQGKTLSEQSKRIIDGLKQEEPEQEQDQKATRRQRKVPPFRFNGQLLLRGKSGNKVRLDLYPFVSQEGESSDLRRLSLVFRHYKQFKDGLDKKGDHRLLLIIVDSMEQIQVIEETYRRSKSYMQLKNILFLDLETASMVDLLASLKVLLLDDSQQHHVLKTTKFNIATELLERPIEGLAKKETS